MLNENWFNVKGIIEILYKLLDSRLSVRTGFGYSKFLLIYNAFSVMASRKQYPILVA